MGGLALPVFPMKKKSVTHHCKHNALPTYCHVQVLSTWTAHHLGPSSEEMRHEWNANPHFTKCRTGKAAEKY